eukprot:204703-Prymnesium_polylepis.1
MVALAVAFAVRERCVGAARCARLESAVAVQAARARAAELQLAAAQTQNGTPRASVPQARAQTARTRARARNNPKHHRDPHPAAPRHPCPRAPPQVLVQTLDGHTIAWRPTFGDVRRWVAERTGAPVPRLVPASGVEHADDVVVPHGLSFLT